MGNSEEFDERGVEKPFQRQSDARTTIHAKCKNDGFPRGMLWVIPMATSAGLRNKQAGFPGRKKPRGFTRFTRHNNGNDWIRGNGY